MLILPISRPNKCRFFAKIQIFIEIFSVKSVKYTEEKKSIDHVIGKCQINYACDADEIYTNQFFRNQFPPQSGIVLAFENLI